MRHEWISLFVFALCYALFVFFPGKRSWVACAGGVLLVVAGVVPLQDALMEKINWNVMGLFCGTLILAEIFLISKVPAVMAEWLVDKARSTRAAMLLLCGLSGFISMFVENVAVVLLVAPVALSLADKLKINPTQLLIGIAVSSNLQGTATMIGDPPSMILAGYMRMGFWDFFVYDGRPGIFFGVQVGAVASFLILGFLFRGHRNRTALVTQEQARSWIPAWLLCALVVGLSFATAVDPEFRWFAGVFTLLLSAIALVWFRVRARWGSTRKLLGTLDWDTTFFLMAVFVLVGGLGDSGWIDRFADLLAGSIGSHPAGAFAAIVLLSVVVSGFVDNVPFLIVMIPVVQRMADQMGIAVPLLMFGLLIGACLGGNLTPTGASANVVAIGILKKHGYPVGFGSFMKVGIPFTAAAVIASAAFVWFVWR